MCSNTEPIARGDGIRSRLRTRFITEDDAQDLVEYALLAAFIGVTSWAVLVTLTNDMGTTYASWLDPTTGVPARWDPPEPGGGS